jgi:nucleotide-binding universal stress UspA family protein
MYQRILVPVDGSDSSKRGLDEALKIALELGSKIRLLHVVDDASLAMPVGAFAVNMSELLASLAKAGEQILAEAKRIAQARGVVVETATRHCSAGRVCDVIVQEAAEWPSDLIVLGSDAEQVLRVAPAPVLLVRDAGTSR